MNTKPNNPQAFPELRHVFQPDPVGLNDKVIIEAKPGMTLRDWFAGQALAGLLSGKTRDTQDEFAAVSYELADAMLRAREGKQ